MKMKTAMFGSGNVLDVNRVRLLRNYDAMDWESREMLISQSDCYANNFPMDNTPEKDEAEKKSKEKVGLLTLIISRPARV